MNRQDIISAMLPFTAPTMLWLPPDRHPGGAGEAQARGYTDNQSTGGSNFAIPDGKGGQIDLGYIPYEWQLVVHDFMARPETRGLVLVVARQNGKSTLCCILLLIAAMFDYGDYAYVAPRRVTAKAVAWPIIKKFGSNIPGIEFKEGDLQAIVPCLTEPGKTSKIHLFGAQDGEDGGSGRGLTLTGIVVDEAGQMTKAYLDEVLTPTQTAIENPWMVVIGTARGRADALYEIYDMAGRTDGWGRMVFTIDDTNILSEEKKRNIRLMVGENSWAREYMCSFDISTTNTLLRAEFVLAAQKRILSEMQHREIRNLYPLVAGLDVGLQRDRSVLTLRCGNAILFTKIYEQPETQALCLGVLKICREWMVDQLFVDVGAAGRAVCDVMRNLGMSPIEINFGGTADDSEAYANKRAEMWDRMRAWVERPDSIVPDDSILLQELTAPTFDYTSTNRMLLEKKSAVSARIGRSVDLADSLCLTFAAKHNFSHRIDPDIPVAHPALRTTGDELVEVGVDGSRYSSSRRTALHKQAHQRDEEWDRDNDNLEVFDPYD